MIHIERYNSGRLNFIKQLLINSVETGKPQDYEIRVDDMKVVPRTNNPELFENYEDFITEQTRRVLVMLYEGVSRKNTKYLFNLKDEDMPKAQEKGLGEIEVAKIVKEKLEQREQQMKQEQMEKENKEMKKQIQQDSEEMHKAAEVIKKLKEDRDLSDLQWGKIIGEAGNTLIRSNTKFLAQIPLPGMKGLAGIIEADNKAQEARIANPQPEPEVQASFSKIKSEDQQDEKGSDKNDAAEKKENPSKNSEATEAEREEKRDQLGLIRQLQGCFEEKEVKQIFSLLNLFVENPKAIEPALNYTAERKAQCNTAKSETKQQTPTENQQQEKKQEPEQEVKAEKSVVPATEIKEEELGATCSEGTEDSLSEHDADEIPATM